MSTALCSTLLYHISGYRNTDDRHRNPNINIREITWLGNQLRSVVLINWTSFNWTWMIILFQLLVFFYLFALSGRGECAKNVATSIRCRWQSLSALRNPPDIQCVCHLDHIKNTNCYLSRQNDSMSRDGIGFYPRIYMPSGLWKLGLTQQLLICLHHKVCSWERSPSGLLGWSRYSGKASRTSTKG